MTNVMDKKLQINMSDLYNLGQIDFSKNNDFLDDVLKNFLVNRFRYANIFGLYAPRIQDPFENNFHYLIGDISFYVSATGSSRSKEKAVESTKSIIIYNSFLKAFPNQMGITSILFNEYNFSDTIVFQKVNDNSLLLIDSKLGKNNILFSSNDLELFKHLYKTIYSVINSQFVFSRYVVGKFYNTEIKNLAGEKLNISQCSDYVLAFFEDLLSETLSKVQNRPQFLNLFCFLEQIEFDYLYYIPSFLINSNNISVPIRGNIALLSENKLIGGELEDFTSLCNILWLKLTMYEFDVKNQASKRLSLQNSITNILSRNFSHNIGSHVMHNADMEHITAKLNPQQGSATLSVAAELNAHRYAAALKSLLDRYIVQRNEYLADVSESTMPAGNYARFYSEVVMPFVENFLLTDNIAAAEGIGFPKYDSNNRLQIRVFVEGKELITLYNGSKIGRAHV